MGMRFLIAKIEGIRPPHAGRLRQRLQRANERVASSWCTPSSYTQETMALESGNRARVALALTHEVNISASGCGLGTAADWAAQQRNQNGPNPAIPTLRAGRLDSNHAGITPASHPTCFKTPCCPSRPLRPQGRCGQGDPRLCWRARVVGASSNATGLVQVVPTSS